MGGSLIGNGLVMGNLANDLQNGTTLSSRVIVGNADFPLASAETNVGVLRGSGNGVGVFGNAGALILQPRNGHNISFIEGGGLSTFNFTDAGKLYAKSNIYTGGGVGIGSGTIPTSAGLYISGGVTKNAVIQRSSADANGQVWQTRKSRGSVASPANVTANDALGAVSFTGYTTSTTGEGYSLGSALFGFAEGSIGKTFVPSNLRFYTTNTAGTFAERMRVTADGSVGIGTTAPAKTLDVSGKTGVTLYASGASSKSTASNTN